MQLEEEYMTKEKEILQTYMPYMKAIKEICTPFLNQYGLTHFWYSRVYLDGTFIDLGLDPQWFLYMLENNFFIFWNDLRIHPTSWPVDHCKFISTPNNFAYHLKPNDIDLITKKYQVHYSFNILINNGSYLENFGFSAPVDNYNSISVYMRYFGILRAFGHYFTQKAEYIIKELEQKGKIQFPQPENNSVENDIFSYQEFNARGLEWSNANFKYYYLSTPKGNSVISARQKDCLSLMAQGKSGKEIAQLLGIQVKTVDAHILRLKDKTGLSSRSALVESFFKSGL